MKRSWPTSKYYPGICLDGLRKTTKTSVRTTGVRADLNLGPPEYWTATFGDCI
jgi:hypothetical protein